MTTTETRWRWLESTVRLQREAFDHDPAEIAKDLERLCESIKDNIFQAARELFEASVEFKSKHWSVDAPYVNRERIIAEIVDVHHFTGNILANLGCSDDEYEAAYQAKQDKNRRRMATGTYSERKGGLGDGSEVE